MTQPPGDPTQPAIPALPGEPPTVAEPTMPAAAVAAEPATPPTTAEPTIPVQPTFAAQPGQPGQPTQPVYVPGQPQSYPPTQAYPPPPGYPQPYPPTQGYPQPYPPTQGYPQPFPPQPYPGYLGQPGYPPQQPPRKRRGLLIGILAGVFVLLLAGGGVSTYLLTRDSGQGQASPQAAVDGFLTAVYTNQDATAAAKFVCPQARDKIKLTAKIDEIKKQSSQYELPKYSWKQPVAKADEHGAPDEVQLTTTVTVRTSTEQHAEQSLLFIATRHNGWWVCEVKQGG
jgi:hypothetical protein